MWVGQAIVLVLRLARISQWGNTISPAWSTAGAAPQELRPCAQGHSPLNRARTPYSAQSSLVGLVMPGTEQLLSPPFIDPVVSTMTITSSGWGMPPFALAVEVAEICTDDIPNTLPNNSGMAACCLT